MISIQKPAPDLTDARTCVAKVTREPRLPPGGRHRTDTEDADGVEDIILETGSDGLREMDEACLVPAVLDAIDDNIGDPEGMRTAVKAVMQGLKSWWRVPGCSGEPHVFRTEKDDLDRRAEEVPETPE